MRKVIFLTALFTFVFMTSLWAADISGTWALKMAGRQGDVSMDLVIKAAGENLTVTAKHPRFGDMAGTGTLKGDAVDMTVTGTGEMKMGIQFKGTINGNKMSGTREMIRPAGAQGAGPGGQGGQGAMMGGQGGQDTQGGMPGGQGQAAGGQAPQGGMTGGQGGQGGAQTQISNTWTAEKK
jgi:hypothetical protein